jgi:hypothetical protein
MTLMAHRIQRGRHTTWTDTKGSTHDMDLTWMESAHTHYAVCVDMHGVCTHTMHLDIDLTWLQSTHTP